MDVMDGVFVPNISFGFPLIQAVRPLTDMVLDVHLMIDRPIRYVERFVQAGADYLTIHIEADEPQNTLKALEKIRAMGCKAAISLKPGTPAEEAVPYLDKVDMILVMTVLVRANTTDYTAITKICIILLLVTKNLVG